MRRLGLSLSLLLMGCGPTFIPPRSILGWDYPFQQPVIGTNGMVPPITDADWSQCDTRADQEAREESAHRRTALYALMRVGVLDLLTFGIVTDTLMAKELEQPETPEETAYRQETYERQMRACLVNRGYAIRVPPPPSRSFGARP